MSIRIERVTQDNWLACARLEVRETQKPLFPVPVVYWLAEAAYCGLTPLAFYRYDDLIGFAVCARDPEDNGCRIMAFMLDKHFQGMGLARPAMKELLSFIRQLYDCASVRLGHRWNNVRAARLYRALGFVEIGHDDYEIIRRLEWK